MSAIDHLKELAAAYPSLDAAVVKAVWTAASGDVKNARLALDGLTKSPDSVGTSTAKVDVDNKAAAADATSSSKADGEEKPLCKYGCVVADLQSLITCKFLFTFCVSARRAIDERASISPSFATTALVLPTKPSKLRRWRHLQRRKPNRRLRKPLRKRGRRARLARRVIAAIRTI